ncbi:hypothetical protein [Streptomyces sp. NPDC019224]|uniref:hypothetical protein n=1 Tax=Streptomyces sp. NPDC019224 TaxID=3154484 RepID=UPI0033C453ED
MPTSERTPEPPRAAVSMTALLAAGAAANAVSTPPAPQPEKKRAEKKRAVKPRRADTSGRAAHSSRSGD